MRTRLFLISVCFLVLNSCDSGLNKQEINQPPEELSNLKNELPLTNVKDEVINAIQGNWVTQNSKKLNDGGRRDIKINLRIISNDMQLDYLEMEYQGTESYAGDSFSVSCKIFDVFELIKNKSGEIKYRVDVTSIIYPNDNRKYTAPFLMPSEFDVTLSSGTITNFGFTHVLGDFRLNKI